MSCSLAYCNDISNEKATPIIRITNRSRNFLSNIGTPISDYTASHREKYFLSNDEYLRPIM